MKISDFHLDLSEEVRTILSSDFNIDVTSTNTVPNSGDPAITFPNLDAKSQGSKLIDTCVLYIDIRRSTQLNLSHKPQTVAKLYSSFVRAMTKCARHFGGHVRGIIGDRVMVIFDTKDAFSQAVDTAILMNSATKYVINKHFNRNEVTCGIGIDAGKMLATKTGVRRKGHEQSNYQNLVWLGRPANIASKLTDVANKDAETIDVLNVSVGYDYGNGLVWRDESPTTFVMNFIPNDFSPIHPHRDQAFRTFRTNIQTITLKSATPPILMTKAVYEGLTTARPDAPEIINGWFKKYEYDLSAAGYTGDLYGGDVVFKAFRN